MSNQSICSIGSYVSLSSIRFQISDTTKKTVAISKDNDYKISNFRQIIPSKMIFGLVENEAYCGSLKTNPFKFGAFDWKE